MNTIYLIRHGRTAGNGEGRYIGRTDQPLCPEGRDQARDLRQRGIPACDRLFLSPYRRCRETAELLFPGREGTVVEDLRECDFGDFEGLNARELAASAPYRAWVEGGCIGQIPGGEAVSSFKSRCREAFLQAAEGLAPGQTAAFVIHGGCIMAILEALALPRRNFYDYHVGNCALVACGYQRGALTILGGDLC